MNTPDNHRGYVPLPTAASVTRLDAKAIRDLAIKAHAIRWSLGERGELLVSMGDLCGLLRRPAA